MIRCAWLLAGLLAIPARAAEIRWSPEAPVRDDVIRIEVAGGSQGGTVHWGVNPRGSQWEPVIPAYRRFGTVMDGLAARTPLQGPDEQGRRWLDVGPFSSPEQAVGELVFAIQWDDGSWENNGGEDFVIPVSSGRIRFDREAYGLNDVVTIRVLRSAPGGELRWGVNAVRGRWQPPDPVYQPAGTKPSGDGLAVDSPLPDPDDDGVSSIVLGSFNRPEQVVTSLHVAVHWGDRWDTDFGRNFNTAIDLAPPGAPEIDLVYPQSGYWVETHLEVHGTSPAAPVTLWLDGVRIASQSNTAFRFDVPLADRAYGPMSVTVHADTDAGAAMSHAEIWHVPTYPRAVLPEGVGLGATVLASNRVAFALHAPGKRFVSLVGDFNGWDAGADRMNLGTNGTWWIVKELPPGRYAYQYRIEDQLSIADPYATDVEWKDELGRETYRHDRARAILDTAAPPFAWSETGYRRPSLESLLIYEFHIHDLAPGQGYTGVIARLDDIRALGVNAIQPLPFTEFPGDHSWGYNPAFHLAPESSYGTPEELKQLVDAAHARGLAVIADLVFNHMDWNSALYRLYGDDYTASPYFRLFTGENWGFPDIEQDTPQTKAYIRAALHHWIRDYRIDGFRYDATRWTEWEGYNDWGAGWYAYAAKEADPGSIQIAEHIPADPALIRDTEMDTGWHAHFRWRIRDMLQHAYLDQAEFEKVMNATALGFQYNLQRMVYTESHDEERVWREFSRQGYRGEELTDRAISALALTLTAPGPAMIYAGQEFGEMSPKIVGWNPLHWELREDPARRPLVEAAPRLCRLRTTHPALTSEKILFHPPFPEPNVAAYTRGPLTDPVVVAVNFGRRPATIALDLPGPGRAWFDQVSGQPVEAGEEGIPGLASARGLRGVCPRSRRRRGVGRANRKGCIRRVASMQRRVVLPPHDAIPHGTSGHPGSRWTAAQPSVTQRVLPAVERFCGCACALARRLHWEQDMMSLITSLMGVRRERKARVPEARLVGQPFSSIYRVPRHHGAIPARRNGQRVDRP